MTPSRHQKPIRPARSPLGGIFPHILSLAFIAAPLFQASADPVIEAVAKQNDLIVHYDKATDFSGITWIGNDNYYAVSNRTLAIFTLKLSLDPASGAIHAAAFGSMIPVKANLSDFEGIAWQPEFRRLYISCENGHGITGFDEAGDARFAVEVPKVFSRARFNKSLESLTFGAGHFWTANEDTLDGDGELSSRSRGGLVRIQKFTSSFKPLAQFAHRTDPSALRPNNTGTGLTDLCALPDGRLLALERVVATGLVAKIYLLDFTDATDVGKFARLDHADFKPARKKLLFERHTGGANYEGIALGPQLAGGWRSLILIADSGGETKHRLMPLRIKLGEAK